MKQQYWFNAYLGLGSNLGNSKKHIIESINEIGESIYVQLKAISSLYMSHPVDGSEQNSFYNTAIHIKTTYSPYELLKFCQKIEKLHNKIYQYKWGPRSLDVDLLCYEQLQLNSKRLTIPHPEIKNRDFVIQPLLEISPNLSVPRLGKLHKIAPPQSNIFEINCL